EQGRNDYDLQLTSQIAEAHRRGTGDGLGQVEEGDVLALAEILRLKQFRQADNLGAFGGGSANVGNGALQVLLRLRGARHLHDANLEVSFRQFLAPARNAFQE